MTSLQYDPYMGHFNVQASTTQGNGKPQQVANVKMTEQQLRAIGDQDINDLVERARINPARAHSLPPRRKRINVNGFAA